MTNLLDLPMEVLQMITEKFEYAIDLCAFSLVNRYLCSLAQREITRHICLSVHQKAGEKGTPLHRAADTGNEACVRKLLQNGYPPDSRAPRMWDPICLAAGSGFTSIVQMFIEHGVDPNPLKGFNTEGIGGNPLTFAVSENRGSVVRLLIEHGVDLEFEEPDEVFRLGGIITQPLCKATERSNYSMVELLLQNGCNPFKPNWSVSSDGGSAWTRAVASNAQILRMFVETSINLDIEIDFTGEDYPRHSDMIKALKNNNLDSLKFFATRGAEMNLEPEPCGVIFDFRHPTDPLPSHGLYLLSKAAGLYPTESEWLLAMIDLDRIVKDKHPRQMVCLTAGAAEGGMDDLLQRLLKIDWLSEHPAIRLEDWEDHLEECMQRAAAKGHFSTVKLLLDHGVDPQELHQAHGEPSEWDPDYCTCTALLAAAEAGFPEIVRLLLDRGARPWPHPYEHTLLERTLEGECNSESTLKIVQILCDRDLLKREGEDPRPVLELIVRAGKDVFQLALQCLNVDLTQIGIEYQRAFLEALDTANIDIIEMFLEAGYGLDRDQESRAHDLRKYILLVGALEGPVDMIEPIIDSLLRAYGIQSETEICAIMSCNIESYLRFQPHRPMPLQSLKIALRKGADPFVHQPYPGACISDCSHIERLAMLDRPDKHGPAIAQLFLDWYDEKNRPFLEIAPMIRRSATMTNDWRLARVLWRWYWPKMYPCSVD